MDTSIVQTRLTEILREVFREPDLQYRADLTAADVPEWDSLSHVDLIVAVESDFGVTLSTRDVRSLRNVGDFVAVIAEKAK